jgi:hypothetical protein
MLVRIARCPLIAAALAGGHPCSAVVAAQQVAERDRQVPEGWAGNLGRARVVFLSSNTAPARRRPGPPVPVVARRPGPHARSEAGHRPAAWPARGLRRACAGARRVSRALGQCGA